MRKRGTLTWRVLVILAAAAVVPTVIVGVLAIHVGLGIGVISAL